MKIIDRMNEAVKNYKETQAVLDKNRESVSNLIRIKGWIVSFHAHCDNPEVSVWKSKDNPDVKSMEFEITNIGVLPKRDGDYTHDEILMISNKLADIINDDSEARDEKKQANELESQIAADYCENEESTLD